MKKLVVPVVLGALLLAGCSTQEPEPTQSTTDSEAVFPAPGSNITLIVPFSAGGTTDVTARAFAGSLSESLGVSVTVVNTPGAGGQLGLTELANSTPDGYTIGFTNLPSAIPTYLVEDRGAVYDRESFVPVAGITRSTNYLAVSASSEYQTLDDLLNAAKARPGEITVGTAGEDEELGVLAAAAKAGVEFNLIPYDGGNDKTTALLGNQVDAIIGGGTTVVPGVKNGDFRALGIFGGTEDPFLPEIPTFKSLGIDIDINGFLTISAPAGTPQYAIDAYEVAIEKATGDATFTELVNAGFQSSFFVNSTDIAKVWTDQEAMLASQLHLLTR